MTKTTTTNTSHDDHTSTTTIDMMTSSSASVCSFSSSADYYDESSPSSTAAATTTTEPSIPIHCIADETVNESAKKEEDYDDDDDSSSCCCIEEMYKLDYEIEPIAAGGEVLKDGIHVYMECTGYQHHAIVLDTSSWVTATKTTTETTAATATTTSDDKQKDKDATTSAFILIAEFTNAALAADTNIDLFQSTSTASGAVSTAEGVEGGFRYIRETDPSQWHVVKYQANPLEVLTWRPGTCSNASPSDISTILSRIQFLHDCCHLIPNYHLLASNCETVAVWCMTGTWETLQGHGFFSKTKLATIAATSVGVVAMPVGIAASGIAVWHEYTIQQQWKQTNQQLNREFSWYNMGRRKRINNKS